MVILTFSTKSNSVDLALTSPALRRHRKYKMAAAKAELIIFAEVTDDLAKIMRLYHILRHFNSK
jgi:hypothetical protein